MRSLVALLGLGGSESGAAASVVDELLENLTLLPATTRQHEWHFAGRGGGGGYSQPPALGMSAGASSATSPGGAHLLSWQATLPSHTSMVVSLDFLKPVRHVDLMPPDVSRGLDVGSAAVWVEHVPPPGVPPPRGQPLPSGGQEEAGHTIITLPDGSTREFAVPLRRGRHQPPTDAEEDAAAAAAPPPPPPPPLSSPTVPPPFLLYTEAAVVPVPIADASMPFNVVAVSSTLIALFVGSMFNNLVMRGAALVPQE